jgi:hypothetical protein
LWHQPHQNESGTGAKLHDCFALALKALSTTSGEQIASYVGVGGNC